MIIMAELVFIGLGNPIRGDDAIGLEVARKASELTGARAFEIASVDFDLLDIIAQNDRIVLIDSVKNKNLPIGHVSEFSINDIVSSKRFCGMHRRNLRGVLELSEKMDNDTARKVKIFAINILENAVFREGLSDELANSIDDIVTKIIDSI